MNNTDNKNDEVAHTGKKNANDKMQMTPKMTKTIARADQKTDGTKKVRKVRLVL